MLELLLLNLVIWITYCLHPQSRFGATPTMKLATVIPLLISSFAASKSLSLFGSDQQILDSELAVPGENPLEYCQKGDNYTLTINNVDLSPNPPSA